MNKERIVLRDSEGEELYAIEKEELAYDDVPYVYRLYERKLEMVSLWNLKMSKTKIMDLFEHIPDHLKKQFLKEAL